MTTESLSVTIEGELLTVEIGTVAAPAGGGGSAAWGAITGTLTDQTDLTTALGLKAPIASPTLTGTPAAPTAAGATSTTQIATTAFVGGEITTHAGATDPHGDRSFATSAVSTHSALTTGAHGLGGASQLNVGTTAGTVAAGDHAHSGVYQPLATVLTNTTAAFTTAQETKLAGIETAADVTDAGNVGAAIDGATAKTTPVDADTVALIDSAAGNVLKKLSWANIKATAKTYFDTLYQAASATLTTWAGITPGTGVGTALAVNVGSVGAPVVNGGALGTPSSGTLTNCTFPTLNQNTTGYAEALKSATTTVSVSAATAPSSGQVLTATSSTAATWQTPSAGGTPAGSDTHVQYNDGGAFGGEAAFSYNKTTNVLTVSSAASVAGTALALTATAPAATTGASVAGVAATVTAGAAVASTDTAGAAAGGSVTITAGAAARLTSGNANGGNIVLAPGAGIGTGTTGQVLLDSDGTVAKPALAFDIGGNTAYGMWYAGGAVKFSANATEALNISAGGITLPSATTGITGNGGVLYGLKRNVWALSSSTTLSSLSYQGSTITNSTAAAAITSTLVTAAVGYSHRFVDDNATYRYTIKPNTADTIIWTDGTVVTAATGSIVSTGRYDSFEVEALNATVWLAFNVRGTWTVTP